MLLTSADEAQIRPSFQVREKHLVSVLQPVLETLRGGINDPWTWAPWLDADVPGDLRHIGHLGPGSSREP